MYTYKSSDRSPLFKNIPSSPPVTQQSRYNFGVTHCTVTLYPTQPLQSPHLLRETPIALKKAPGYSSTQRKGLQLNNEFACGSERQTETHHLTPLFTWNVRPLAGICLCVRGNLSQYAVVIAAISTMHLAQP